MKFVEEMSSGFITFVCLLCLSFSSSLATKPDVKCPENEVFAQQCFDSCNDYLMGVCQSPPLKCFCAPGFKRIDGTCRPQSECYNCTLPEVYTDCNSPCTYNCPPPPDKPEGCADVCIPGCGCQKNYKRSRKTGKCIPVEKCKYQPITT